MKTRIEDLSIFGGLPAFDEQLHVGRPNIGDRRRLLERINDLLDRRWLTNDGPYVQELERRIAGVTGVRHCIATCSATVALEIATRAAGLTGEVIIPSFTFVATAHALQWQGITPVFCDINPQTYTIDPSLVEQLITKRTTGIIGVHLWAHPCNVEALAQIAHHHNLKLLFDASHAFGCSYKGRMIANFGDAEVFSFHATKVVNTFEGGAIVTNDDELGNKIRLMRNFGFAEYDDVVSLGINGKMNEASAAMGLTSLESMQEFIGANRKNYEQYKKELSGIPGVSLLAYNEDEQNNYQYIILEVDEAVAQLSRDQLQTILWAENILVRRYFYPGCHRMEPYRSYMPDAGQRLSNTNRLAARVLSLPTGATVGQEEINKVCRIIRFVIAHSLAVSERFLNHAAAEIPA
ncbi:MAG: DegT/DnrJ/EryC1/StrS family aminotransferase [Acidobacteriota bacterium]